MASDRAQAFAPHTRLAVLHVCNSQANKAFVSKLSSLHTSRSNKQGLHDLLHLSLDMTPLPQTDESGRTQWTAMTSDAVCKLPVQQSGHQHLSFLIFGHSAFNLSIVGVHQQRIRIEMNRND